MQTVTASEAQAKLCKFINEAVSSHQPIVIAGKRSRAVLIGREDWDAIQETLFLLSVPVMRVSIKQGLAEPLASSATELKW